MYDKEADKEHDAARLWLLDRQRKLEDIMRKERQEWLDSMPEEQREVNRKNSKTKIIFIVDFSFDFCLHQLEIRKTGKRKIIIFPYMTKHIFGLWAHHFCWDLIEDMVISH